MNIDKIILGYLEAALWTEEEQILEETNVQIDMDMVSETSKENIKKDIEKFLDLAGETAINEAIDTNGEKYLGHDILLTRNRHGAGFFDHGYENEKALEDAAQELGTIHIFYQDGEIILE